MDGDMELLLTLYLKRHISRPDLIDSSPQILPQLPHALPRPCGSKPRAIVSTRGSNDRWWAYHVDKIMMGPFTEPCNVVIVSKLSTKCGRQGQPIENNVIIIVNVFF